MNPPPTESKPQLPYDDEHSPHSYVTRKEIRKLRAEMRFWRIVTVVIGVSAVGLIAYVSDLSIDKKAERENRKLAGKVGVINDFIQSVRDGKFRWPEGLRTSRLIVTGNDDIPDVIIDATADGGLIEVFSRDQRPSILIVHGGDGPEIRMMSKGAENHPVRISTDGRYGVIELVERDSGEAEQLP